MTSAKNSTPIEQSQQLARRMLDDNSHFVKALTEVADTRAVVASEDIYASGGMKLVSRGTRLSGKFYDQLIEHKLLKPIEQSLSIADAIDATRLLSLVRAEACRVPSLAPLLDQPGSLKPWQEIFRGLKIPAPLTLRLSVMQESRPALFAHGLITAMIATELGIRGKLPRENLQALALASVFHDAGELCIDPAILEPAHRMTADERRHMYAHPITGFLMLRDFPDLPRETASAVLQHHERLDGSGYPYRLTGEQIGVVGRYLAVAEVAASLLAKNGADRRISMKLRLNRKKYDPLPIALVDQLFTGAESAAAPVLDEALMMTRFTRAGQLFDGWVALRKTLSPTDMAAISFLVERVDAQRMMVLETGFDPCRLEDALAAAASDDPAICMELTVLLDEVEWQFRALSRELERKAFPRGVQVAPTARNGLDAWLAQLRQFVSE